MKLKVMTIVGTRPEIIRLSLIIKKLDKQFEHILVNTKQNDDFSLNDIFFKDLEIREPNFILNVSSENTGHTIGNIISETYDLMLKIKPDCVLILGDTNTALSAISAKKLKIPIFHMEAGNRSFDINLPEEINRKIVDEISDINLPYSERARFNLIQEGKQSHRIFKTGSPLFEVLEFYKNRINESKILTLLNLTNDDYILLSIHRNENISSKDKLLSLLQNVEKASNHFLKNVIVSMHPSTLRKIDEFELKIPTEFQILKPFSFFDYVNLQRNAFCVISDSGSLAEESTILNFCGVSLRDSTERQESFEFGNLILANFGYDNLINSINLRKSIEEIPINKMNDYFISDVSTKVINIIQSYTPILLSNYFKKFSNS